MPKTLRELGQKREARDDIKPPRLYAVIIHNDDYTTMDFVVRILMGFFHKTPQEAAALMMDVHTKGAGVCGVYTYDIAITKAELAELEAEKEEFPLKITVEPADAYYS